MRIVLQRVQRAEVRVAGSVEGVIGPGMLLLVGIEQGDGEGEVREVVRKLTGLRIFEDAGGRMNLDASSIGGAFLVVSQFTLLGSTKKGRRPSFARAARPEVAEPLITQLADGLREQGFEVATGIFGAHMEVELVNDGPVTLVYDVLPGDADH